MDILKEYKLNNLVPKIFLFNIIWFIVFCSDSTPWTIFRIPVDLKKGHVISHSFSSNRTFKLQIQLDVKTGKNTISHYEKILADEVDIDWKIQSDKSLIAHGQSSGPMLESVWGGGRARRVLGEFNGVEGVNYKLELKINKDAPNLAGADPHILIEPDRELYKSGENHTK